MPCIQKRIPVELLDDVISYNSHLGVYERDATATKCINPVNRNKPCEFLWILEQQTKSPFDEDDWEHEEVNTSQHDALCICSQRITHAYTIKHIPTEQSFLVGSECVRKISKSLYNEIVKEKCVVCAAPILDKRTKLGKKNICSAACNVSILPFGKYKGHELSTIPVSYLEWLYKQEWVSENIKDLITYHVFEKPTKKKKYH